MSEAEMCFYETVAEREAIVESNVQSLVRSRKPVIFPSDLVEYQQESEVVTYFIR